LGGGIESTRELTEDKGNTLHSAVCEAFLPLDIKVFEALARGVEVVDGDADVADCWKKIDQVSK
jgi:hypothetical protein